MKKLIVEYKYKLYSLVDGPHNNFLVVWNCKHLSFDKVVFKQIEIENKFDCEYERFGIDRD